MKLSRISLFAAFLIAPLAGCSSSTSPGTSNTTTIPGVGTTYTTSTDDGSGVPTTTVYTVVQSNTTKYGKSNVNVLTEDDAPTDTLYFSYSSNGDVSERSTSTGHWITFAFGTQSTVVANFTDDPQFGSGVDTTRAAGTGSATVLGNTFATQKATWTESIENQGALVQLLAAEIEYPPTIGYPYKLTSHILGTTSVEVLTGYTLK